MSSGSALDLNVTADAFAAAHADHLQAKRNRTTQATSTANRRAVAQWGDLVDDFMIACQAATRLFYRGTGSPESAVAAPVGSIYHRTDGSAGTTLYVKESGSGNTGWIALATASGAASIAVAGHTACSVIGRSANSSGNAADIAIAEGQFLGRRSNVVGSYAIAATDLSDYAGLVRSLASVETDVDVTATDVITTLFTATIPANTVTAGRRLHLRIGGDYLNNSGSTRTFELRISFGGVEIYRDTSQGQGTSANRRAWNLDLALTRKTSTTLHAFGQMFMGNSSLPDTGLGQLDAVGTGLSPSMPIATDPTTAPVVDFTASQVLLVEITHSNNSASISMRSRGGGLVLQ